MRLASRLTGRLSQKRRSPFAGLVVLLLGLVITGAAYAGFAPANADARTSDTASVAKGRQLFMVGCAFCHGQHGEGVLTKDGNEYGPPLVGVGAAAVDFQVGTGRMPLAQPGVQALSKEPVYNEQEIRELAAYVASLGPGPSVPAKDDYDPAAIPANQREKQIADGGEFFRTNCTACHNFAGSGGALPHGKFAPKLRGVSAKHMYEAMLTGPQQMPVFGNGVIKPEEKREIIAFLKKNEKTPEYGGFSLGSIGPVSEGLFAWVLGLGALVGFAVWIASQSTRSDKHEVDV